MNFCELTFLITALANSISSGLTTDELDLLSAVFTQLADTLATISARREILEDKD